jgi:hypothetical protein
LSVLPTVDRLFQLHSLLGRISSPALLIGSTTLAGFPYASGRFPGRGFSLFGKENVRLAPAVGSINVASSASAFELLSPFRK